MRKTKHRWLIPHIYKYLQQGGDPDPEDIVNWIQANVPTLSRRPKSPLKKAVSEVLESYQENLKQQTPQANPPQEQQPRQTRRIQSYSSLLKLQDLGGMDHIIEEIQRLIIYPLKHVEIFNELRIEPVRGILLTGPPGCGKTFLADAICGELSVPFYKISGTEIVSGVSGQSEQKLRTLFRQAQESSPSIIFIDEIDAIASKRSSSNKDMERRIVSQLFSCMDDLGGFLEHGQVVIVIAATNMIDQLDPALRRAGRFDREIHMGIPTEPQRESILKSLTHGVKIRGDLDTMLIAKRTPGYVAADLHALIKEAGNSAISRGISLNSLDLSNLYIEQNDFIQALQKVQPSSRREGFSTVPDITWNDVGGLQSLREELHYTIVNAISNPESYTNFGITPSAGVLLYGPPGCGKTLVAKAVANSSSANFIAVNGPELLNKYVGESERAIRQLFQRARDSSPCVVFFDEIDAICSKRGSDNNAQERVVNQLLTELCGVEDRKEVYVIAASNRPDVLDPALLRPGRLDKLLYVPLPSQEDRLSILQTLTRSSPLGELRFEEIAESARNYSGADLLSLVREAACQALKEDCKVLEMSHFVKAMQKIVPSVTENQAVEYERLRSLFSR